MSMNPEIKAQWVAALRSGDYAQTKGALHRLRDKFSVRAGYCCLGVLCDLAVKAGVTTEDAHGETAQGVGQSSFGWDHSASYLPTEVVAWAGLYERNPVVSVGGQCREHLSDLNDDRGCNFEEIADAIERTTDL